MELLAHSPLLGGLKPELELPDKAFRYFPVLKAFVVVYEPAEDGIRVARLLHGARFLAEELAGDSGMSD